MLSCTSISLPCGSSTATTWTIRPPATVTRTRTSPKSVCSAAVALPDRYTGRAGDVVVPLGDTAAVDAIAAGGRRTALSGGRTVITRGTTAAGATRSRARYL